MEGSQQTMPSRIDTERGTSGSADAAPELLSPSDHPAELAQSLTPEFANQLKKRNHEALAFIMSRNAPCQYFRNGPLLKKCRDGLEALGGNAANIDATQAFALFNDTVPLSSYPDMKPTIDSLFKRKPEPALSSHAKDLLAPGYPSYIAISSATSGKEPKIFPTYNHPHSEAHERMMKNYDRSVKAGGRVMILYSLRYSDVLVIENDLPEEDPPATTEGQQQQGQQQQGQPQGQQQGPPKQAIPTLPPWPKRIPVCAFSAGTVRKTKKLPIEFDPYIKRVFAPNSCVPLAVPYISSYQSLLLANLVFSLSDPHLELMNTIFATFFMDMVKQLEENWDQLVVSIEEGTLPMLKGADDVVDILNTHFKANPERAAELRRVQRKEGWFHAIWPNLEAVVCTCSGSFENVVPKIRWHLGPNIALQAAGFTASEAIVGLPYSKFDLNLFRVMQDDLFEYLPVRRTPSGEDDGDLNATAADLVHAWDLEVGGDYEVVLTTRDGFWRYRLGDVVTVAGFDPADGQPVVRFKERRGMAIRLGMTQLHESELRDAVAAFGAVTSDAMGVRVAEFSVVADLRRPLKSLGFIVEMEGDLDVNSPAAQLAVRALHDKLCSLNDNYAVGVVNQREDYPTLRVLPRGTFADFRNWKVGGNGMGQVKVPVVVKDEGTRVWLEERVMAEIIRKET
ncbi:hypothetical protein HK101_006229 [Irineochytrium annulatum]|nr:hypothetical protein HK101_006229 [Irineochytrium annulatum]